jgi:hypothetical protein
MANLRLDTREGIFSSRPNGKVVTPGNAGSSLLFQRISHQKEALRMPPPAAKKILTSQQRDLLRRWIEQGANWKEHWSFQPLSRPPVPRANIKTNNPIDAFIRAKLETLHLAPNPEADRRTLIRRVSLDLTGLPPSPAEVEDFLADTSPNAYAKVVDRLLASPHYGEHRGRYWLDAARYADTHGIHIDNYREMWPYRDWVIQAFNRNQPFDRFTVEQLAGDLLPNHTVEQQVATGFHRCNMTTNEGGSIPEEVAAMYAKDRVETTGTVWLGLTIGCASCHDHKFDPIAQKEFYQFAAFFRNTTQDPMDGNIPDTPPVVVIPAGRDAAKWAALRAEAASARSKLQILRGQAEPQFEPWLAERQIDDQPLDTPETLALTTLPLTLPKNVTAGAGPDSHMPALHFSNKSTYAIAEHPGFTADKPFSVAAWVYLPGADENITVASQLTTIRRTAKTDDDDDAPGNSTGWIIEVNGRIPTLRLIAGKSNIRVRGSNVERLQPKTWNHLTFTYDGSRGQNGLAFYLNGKTVTNVNDGGDAVELKGDIRNPAPLKLGGGAVAGFRVYDRVLRQEEAQILATWNTIQSAAGKDSVDLTGAERGALLNYYLNRHDANYIQLANQFQQFEYERRAIRRRGAVTHVMQEKTDTKPMAHVLFRGQYDQPREEVIPSVPSVLPPMPASFPRNRLGLAQWLVDPANPLTARVTVNRFWQEIFGTGLVRTAEDFGSQGELPTHPELLDWLALEFRESGWDVKKLIRLIVTSDTYRQSARVSEDKLKADPENRLLSRGPRFRMDAEMIRDLALSAGGLLNDRIGGPSVKPYQPPGVWETVAMKSSNTKAYEQEHGDKLYRRSLYTFWKRAAPPASMEIFNAPTRENCTVRRERTNTPLQALVTMNDPQFIEASRNLAEQAMEKAAPDTDSRLDFMTVRVVARPFRAEERKVIKTALKDFLTYYDSHRDRAGQLLSVGESKPDQKIAVEELAAWTMLASDLLNLDEALNK